MWEESPIITCSALESPSTSTVVFPRQRDTSEVVSRGRSQPRGRHWSLSQKPRGDWSVHVSRGGVLWQILLRVGRATPAWRTELLIVKIRSKHKKVHLFIYQKRLFILTRTHSTQISCFILSFYFIILINSSSHSVSDLCENHSSGAVWKSRWTSLIVLNIVSVDVTLNLIVEKWKKINKRMRKHNELVIVLG